MKIHKTLTFGVLLIVLCLASETNLIARNNLDATFGNGGVVITPITNSPLFDSPSSMTVQLDGKIVVCGEVLEEDFYGDAYTVAFFLARYNPTGTLDTSFGTNGKVVAFGGELVGRDLALQPDGKILVVGFRATGTYVFAVNRFNSDGTLDASFGSGGKVATAVPGAFGLGERITVDPDGKIVIAGYTHLGGGDFAFAVVRYNANGLLDTSFGTGGIVITPIGNNYVRVGTVLVQPNAKIVVVGGSGINNLFTLVRYNTDGSLDSGFGSDGKVIHSLGSGPASFSDGVLQPDGKIVAVGWRNASVVIIRYNANGSIDSTFGANGVFITGFDNNYSQSIALQPDGKILAFEGESGAVAAVRLKPDGSLDTRFGVNGVVITPIIASSFTRASASTVQSDGRILALSQTFAQGFNGSDLAIVRYLGDAAVSNATLFDFDGDGKSDISVFRQSDNTWHIDGSTQGISSTEFGLSTDKITPADFDGDGKTDIAVFRDGVWFWLNSSNGTMLQAGWGVVGDTPQPADFTGDGRSDLAVYRGGTWFIYDIHSGISRSEQFGLPTDRPVAADYDGDGRSDIAVYRDGVWYLSRSSDGFAASQFGISTDKLVPADYDGDGKTDLAVFRDGTWYLQKSAQGFAAIQFGAPDDIPVPADYDGNARADLAVFRNGVWYLQQSPSGFAAIPFGLASDTPIPAAFIQ